MSRSKQSKKFWLIAAGTFAGAIAVSVALTPVASEYVAFRAAEYAATARSSQDEAKQIGHYRLALALDPQKSAYRSELASVYLKQNNLEAAISVLGDTKEERIRKAGYQLSLGLFKEAEQSIAPLDSPEAAIIRSRIALEQGNAPKAYQAVKSPRNDSERLQLGLSYTLAGMSDNAREVLVLMKAGEQKRRLERIQGGGVALAQELYRERLYRSAERVLKQAGESGEKYLLLAHVQLEQASSDKKSRQAALSQAKTSLAKGVGRDPANLKLRELLREVYQHQGDETGVSRENQAIQKLRTGKL